jgi:hypothetical protein
MSNYSMGFFRLSDLDLIRHYNQAKDVLLDTLVSEHVITSEQGEELGQHLVFVPLKKGLLGRMWDKLSGDIKPDETNIQLLVLKKKEA